MKVETPISSMVIRKVFLRPTLSPMRPKIRAPRGRTAKPAANTSRARISPVISFMPEKNRAAISGAREA